MVKFKTVLEIKGRVLQTQKHLDRAGVHTASEMRLNSHLEAVWS